ncbi:cytochrome C oxidase Cbb3 [Phycisphaerales bacterium AB-hyl4]|uniref:Cytochrome C oxidase Cbb3 n=1 Tax=Natronomicrosphaera hydrolytica TaxID=3242702 RepID=A0ABV4U851_9BACT
MADTQRPEPTTSSKHAPRRSWKWWLLNGVGVLLVLFAVGTLILLNLRFEYAYMPAMSKVVNDQRWPSPAYEVWGREVWPDEVDQLMQTAEGRELLHPSQAIRIDEDFLQLGREAFYKETFSNEYFLTDVLGVLDGPITATAITRAIIALAGRGTNNLQVRLSEDITIGDRTFHAGDLVDTGIDVPRGAFMPIGFKTVYDRGQIRTGVTCAACHVTVDPDSGRVLEGVVNPNLNMGLLLAMASNSAAYFARTDIDLNEMHEFFTDPDRTVTINDEGEQQPLPDPELLEAAASEMFLKWPPGNFDTMIDLEANPTRTPDAFTRGDDPYGWTGFGSIGPFRGLNSLGNNVHAFNTDPIIEMHVAPDLLDLHEERYLAILLQNAANPDFRYDPNSNERPSEFLRRINPHPEGPGLAEAEALPTYPRSTALAAHSVIVSRYGQPVWHDISAMSAFQNALVPPEPPIAPNVEQLQRGRRTFVAAGCIDCHTGDAFTNNQIIPASIVADEPDRATAMKGTREIFDPNPQIWALDAIVPVARDTEVIDVPYTHIRTDEQLARAMGHDGEGGYKVKGLIGLYWNPPYMHTGAVAVGPDPETDLGMPGTLLRGVLADPANSLRAMIDRNLRERVVQANRTHEDMEQLNVWGIGHRHWVDEQAGFSRDDQDALIHYLLLLGHHDEARPPDETDRPE